MKYYLTTLFLVCLTLGYSQNTKPLITVENIELDTDNKYASRTLVSKVGSMLKKEYKVAPDAFFTLSGLVSIGDSKTINGMDTYTIAETTVHYTISASGKKAAKTSIVTKCKATSERELRSKIGTSLARDAKHREALLKFVSEYVAEQFNSCSDVSKSVTAAIQKNKPVKAYGILAYYDTLTDCEAVKEEMEGKVLDAYEIKACEDITHQAEILANSGSVYKLNKAVDQLLMIPPNAPCKDEVMRISELIGKNALELKAKNADRLSERISIHNNLSSEEWRNNYRKSYYR